MIKKYVNLCNYNLIKKLDEKFYRNILMFPPPPNFFKMYRLYRSLIYYYYLIKKHLRI